jgi:hypothetical protein
MYRRRAMARVDRLALGRTTNANALSDGLVTNWIHPGISVPQSYASGVAQLLIEGLADQSKHVGQVVD